MPKLECLLKWCWPCNAATDKGLKQYNCDVVLNCNFDKNFGTAEHNLSTKFSLIIELCWIKKILALSDDARVVLVGLSC